MKALIMAAGKGSRISEKIHDIPKCTLPLSDGTPVIRKSVQMMLDLGIEPVLCLGYKGNLVRQALEDLYVRYYENPFFSVTNNVASLWFTRPELDGTDDILLLSGDLYYPRAFLEKALNTADGLNMFVDSGRIYDGDFYFKLSEDGFIERYGSQLPLSMRQYEYMGITKVASDWVPAFAEKVVSYVEEERYQTYFEDVVLALSREKKERINLIDVAGNFWREFDYYEDYELILQHERDSRV